MLEKHQLTGPNFNEWLRALKLVVHTGKLQDVFETPLPLAPAASADNQALADWNALFDRHNEVACLMLGTIYLDQLATLNYAFLDKVSISFILNSLSSEFQAFVQNYNMQSMEKTISEVHSLLIEFEKSIKRNKQQIVGASSTPHGLRGAKKLKRGSLYLYMGNGVRAEVEAIGSFDLVLPNGLIIVLDNCYYAPSITR
ncbi:hypothetical protein Tco_1325517, partial [Tanacetum coccineum]